MRRFSLILLFIASFPAVANEAAAWLKEMSQSLMQSNYRGVFVYEMGGRMEAMQITHAMRDDGEYERLMSLTGHPREVIRSPEGVTCIMPRRKAVMVDKNMPRTPVPHAFLNNLDRITEHYDLVLGEDDRVSGQDSRIISVSPRDEYRYGYKLWLTVEDKLPVRLELLMPQGEVLEQMMFTDLTVMDELPNDWLEPELDGSKLNLIGKEKNEIPVNEGEGDASRWQFAWLPQGFERTHHTRHVMPKKHSQVEHLVYSDGLATVSIYIEQLDVGKPRLQGLKTMGATHALGAEIDDYQVTVVGELPAATIEKIATALRLVENSNDD